MNKQNWRWLTRAKLPLGILLSLFLVACGGGGGSSDSPTAGGITQARAVDPYISGAVFQEVPENGGAPIQKSGATNAQGLATFSKPLTPGSIVELVPGKTGSDSQNPFSGILKRKVGPTDTGILVASPLSTLVANGATAQNVVQDLQLAGITGITASDVNRNPMAGLDTTQQNVTDGQMKLLQANMAVNAFMSAVNTSAGAYDLNAQALEDPTQAALFSDMISAAQQILDPSLFQQLADQVQTTSGAPVTVGDFINTASGMLHSIASQVNADVMSKGMQNLSSGLVSTLLTNGLKQAPGIMQGIYTTRMSTGADSGSGGATAPDGATLYSQDCASCHGALATSAKTSATATQIQVAIDGNMGGMGSFSTLTSAEVQAIADALATTSGGGSGSGSGRPPPRRRPPLPTARPCTPAIAPAAMGPWPQAPRPAPPPPRSRTPSR